MDVNLVKKLIVCRQCRVASFFLFTEQRSGSWEINGEVGRLCLSVSSCADRTRMARLLKWCQLLIPPLPAPASMCYSWPKKNLYRQALTCPCYSTLPYRQIRILFMFSFITRLNSSLLSSTPLSSQFLSSLLLAVSFSSLHTSSHHTQEREESMGLY